MKKTIKTFTIAQATLAPIFFMALSAYGAQCPLSDPAPYIFCSVTIGSETELDVFKAEAGVPVDAIGTPTDRTNDVRSADGCILFHEYVRLEKNATANVDAYGPQRLPKDPVGGRYNSARNSYPWHEEMLEGEIAGYPGRTCDALIISGHHDFGNMGSNGMTTGMQGGVPVQYRQDDTAGNCGYGYCVKRNQFIYSNEFYNYEDNLPKVWANNSSTLNRRATELPSSSTDFFGPRLQLSQLVRTREVCGNSFTGSDRIRTDDYPGTPGATSGKTLLSGLKTVFLMACNLASADNFSAEKGVWNYVNAVKLPRAPSGKLTTSVPGRPGTHPDKTAADMKAEDIQLKSYTFKDRTQIIFGKASELYAFPAFAPGGAAVKEGLQDFLHSQIQTHYPAANGRGYLTSYLAYLSGFISPDMTATQFAACMAKKFNPSCEMIRTGQRDQDYIDPTDARNNHRGNHVIQCALDKATLPTIRADYCKQLKSFYEYWDANKTDVRKKLLACQLNGAAERTAMKPGTSTRYDTTYSDYDLKWFY
ncbi:MAG: hypothetical protein H7301_07345 [Cryobacterium sp.]|nr:hypothetical protein [Oligoflexia bacterium]